MLSTGAVVAGRYQLQHLIATGGMGQVWEATDTSLDRLMAIKILRPEYSHDHTFLDRFRNEARTTAQLSAPGIAGVYDYGETRDDSGATIAYLVMELVRGEALNAVLARLGRLPVDRALDMLEQTARGLQVAHAAGVVHRDVKPGNLLITATGEVKITDFGIARVVDAAPVTQTGMVMGTAQYISPEQAIGQRATPASDIYALSVVGYEALAGYRPFTSETALTVAMQHVRDTPPPLPSDIPMPVRELIDFGLRKEPEQRYANGQQYADAVAAVRAGRRPPPPNSTAVPTAMMPATQMTPTAAANPPAAPTQHFPAPSGYAPSAKAKAAPASSGAAGRVLTWVAMLALLAALALMFVYALNHGLLDRPSSSDETTTTPSRTTTTTKSTTTTTTPTTTTTAPTPPGGITFTIPIPGFGAAQ